MRLWLLFTGSFHSAATYRDVRTANHFFMGYALLVVVACTLAVTVYYAAYIHREIFTARDGRPALFDDVVKQVASQLPVMTLKDKTLASNDEHPTIIRISGEAFDVPFDNFEIITIDTSGTSTHENMKTPILITAKEVVLKGREKTEIKSMTEMTENAPATMLLNRAVIDDLATRLIDGVHDNLLSFYFIIGSICWFFIVIYMYVARLIMVLALGVVGLAIGSLTQTPISYTSAVGLAVVSFTPIALLDTLLFAVMHYPTSTIVLFAAGCVALFAAMKCSSDSASPPVA